MATLFTLPTSVFAYLLECLLIEEVTVLDNTLLQVGTRECFLSALVNARFCYVENYPPSIRIYLQKRRIKKIPTKLRLRKGFSPLLWACITGHIDVVDMLMKNQDTELVSMNRNDSDLTASQVATLSGNFDIVVKLKEEYGIDQEPIQKKDLYCLQMSDEIYRLVIPDYITILPINSFYRCHHLSEVVLHENLLEIESRVFHKCISLKYITLPNSVKRLGSECFADCTGLESIHLPENLSVLEDETFRCAALKEVTFPNSLQIIRWKCFMGCMSLERVDLSSTKVERVDANAFEKCTELKTLIFSPSMKFMGLYCFRNCVQLSHVRIPGSVNKITKGAFLGCRSLQTVILEEGLTVIDEQAFFGCTQLETVHFATTITEIRNFAFSRCQGLVNIDLSMTKVSKLVWVFDECLHLKKISLPLCTSEFRESCLSEGCIVERR